MLLRDPRWQKKRLEIFNRDNWCCRFCGAKENELHVHHVMYLTDHLPWDYPNQCLITLCKDCHFKEEKLKSEDGLLMGNLLLSGLSRMDLYVLASALRTYFSNPGDYKFQRLTLFLHGFEKINKLDLN